VIIENQADLGREAERLKNLGVRASRAGVTSALAELAHELEVSTWVARRLFERGTDWILEPKSEFLALLSGVRGLPVKEAKILSEEHKAVLLVIIGCPRKGGVSKDQGGRDNWAGDLSLPGRSFWLWLDLSGS
jgi:hypothetical protein